MLKHNLNRLTFGFIAVGFVATLVVFNFTDPISTRAENVTIYDFDSKADSTFSSSVGVTTNLVMSDSLSTQTFTLNVGSFTYVDHVNDISWLGAVNSTSLTGTSAGQFVYGSPTLQSLATTTNLVNNSKLYGLRINQNIDLTNYQNITVTFSWASGGDSSSYSGFIAKSLTSDSEAWSTVGSVQVPMDLTTAGSISYVDTSNNVLIGTQARFALIFGSSKSKAALKDFMFKVEGSLRTTLNSISDLGFNHSGNYIVDESIPYSDLLFTANYSYRIGGNTVSLNASTSGAVISDLSDTPYSNPFSFSSGGSVTLKLTYTDPNGFGVQSNTISINIEPIPPTLTGIELVDENGTSYYVYEFYEPAIKVYPLYDGAVTHDPEDLPLLSSEYTLDHDPGELLKANMTLTAEHVVGEDTFTDTLGYTVTARNLLSIGYSNQQLTYVLNETFSLGGLIVTSYWDASPPIDSYSGISQPLTVAPANIMVRGFCFGSIWQYKSITPITHQSQGSIFLKRGELVE